MNQDNRKRTVWGEGFGWDDFDPLSCGAEMVSDDWQPDGEKKSAFASGGFISDVPLIGLDHTDYMLARLVPLPEPGKGIFITEGFTITVDIEVLSAGAEEMARQLNAFFDELRTIFPSGK